MSAMRPSGAHPDRAGDRDHNPPRAWGELRPDELTRIREARASHSFHQRNECRMGADELTRIREARASLAASGVRVSMAGAVRLYRMHALDLDAAAVLTRPDRVSPAVLPVRG